MAEEFKISHKVKTSDDLEKWRLYDSTDTVVIEVIKGASQTWTAQAMRQVAEEVEKKSVAEWEELNSGAK
jgi:hypothetical protein